MGRTHVVTSVGCSRKVLHKLLTGPATTFSVAFQFARVKRSETIGIVAIATPEEDAYVFDIKEVPSIMLDGQLWRLLQAPDVIKVIHDCRQASVALRQQFKVNLTNVFDTQACYSLLLLKENMDSRSINRHCLYNKFGDDGRKLMPDIEESVDGDSIFWAQRPLTREMVQTAATNALVLFSSVYDNLKQELSNSGISMDTMDNLCEAYIKGKVKEQSLVLNNSTDGKKNKRRPIIKLTDRQRNLLESSMPSSETGLC